MNEDEKDQLASEIRARLIEARKAKNYTHEQMGSFFGMSKQGWRRYEDTAELKASMIVQVCAVLECSPSWLLGVEDEGRSLPPESELLKSLKREFDKLNARGQRKAVEDTRELSFVPEYRKSTETVQLDPDRDSRRTA